MIRDWRGSQVLREEKARYNNKIAIRLKYTFRASKSSIVKFDRTVSTQFLHFLQTRPSCYIGTLGHIIVALVALGALQVTALIHCQVALMPSCLSKKMKGRNLTILTKTMQASTSQLHVSLLLYHIYNGFIFLKSVQISLSGGGMEGSGLSLVFS